MKTISSLGLPETIQIAMSAEALSRNKNTGICLAKRTTGIAQVQSVTMTFVAVSANWNSALAGVSPRLIARMPSGM